MCKFHCKSILGPLANCVTKAYLQHIRNKIWNISLPFYLSNGFTMDFSWGGQDSCGNCTYFGKTKKSSIHYKVLQKCSYTVGMNPYCDRAHSTGNGVSRAMKFRSNCSYKIWCNVPECYIMYFHNILTATSANKLLH